jgi:ferredoxin
VELTDLEGATHHLEVPEDANILEVALDQGLDMPYDCKMGVCL